MQKNLTYSKSVRFRRFMCKGYAVFCSLKKEISIGFLSVDTNNCSLKLQKINLEPRTRSQEPRRLEDVFENILEILGLQPTFAVALVSTQNNKVDAFDTQITQILYDERRFLIYWKSAFYHFYYNNKTTCHFDQREKSVFVCRAIFCYKDEISPFGRNDRQVKN